MAQSTQVQREGVAQVAGRILMAWRNGESASLQQELEASPISGRATPRRGRNRTGKHAGNGTAGSAFWRGGVALARPPAIRRGSATRAPGQRGRRPPLPSRSSPLQAMRAQAARTYSMKSSTWNARRWPVLTICPLKLETPFSVQTALRSTGWSNRTTCPSRSRKRSPSRISDPSSHTLR